MAIRIDRNQVVGPDGTIISEQIVDVEVPDPVDEDALLNAIEGAQTFAEFQQAMIQYLRETRGREARTR